MQLCCTVKNTTIGERVMPAPLVDLSNSNGGDELPLTLEASPTILSPASQTALATLPPSKCLRMDKKVENESALKYKTGKKFTSDLETNFILDQITQFLNVLEILSIRRVSWKFWKRFSFDFEISQIENENESDNTMVINKTRMVVLFRACTSKLKSHLSAILFNRNGI